MTPDVDDAFRAEADGPRPSDDRKADGDGDSDEPEPEERVDLLVEEVDRQHALQRVAVHGAHLTNGKVAQRHRRKSLRAGTDGRRAADDALQLVARQRVGDHLRTQK